MRKRGDLDIGKVMETDLTDQAMARGVRAALVRHKLLGHPIAVEEDGVVKWIPPEEIEIPPEIPPAIYEPDDDEP